MIGDAVVVGSGPNGLAAGITLAQAGLDVEIHEAQPEPGGAARSMQLTLPGFLHDFGSAVYPFAVSSPFFSKLNLNLLGLRWIHPDAPLAHPLDDGTAVMQERDLAATAGNLEGADKAAWRELFQPLVDDWAGLMDDLLRPLFHLPRHPIEMGRFGIHALQPALLLARTKFRGERARALFGGLAAHSIRKLESPLTSAFGLMLGASAHAVGWPIAAGGGQSITNALIAVFKNLGGRIITNSRVSALSDLDRRDLTLCDVSPRQFLQIAAKELDGRPFADLMRQYKYGPGAYKMDWALREPIPWRAKECLRAGTVHLGGTLDEIAASERGAMDGHPPAKPFVLLSQPSLFDPTRAPLGQHTAWAYCHVPNGWPHSVENQIEAQIERFAPGFRECILARHCSSPLDLERCDENLIGGDVNCGTANINQFVFRPTWRLYGTPLKGVYFCSSATPPGGGVHGMCGYNAANAALRWMHARGKTVRRKQGRVP
ncbi:MAG TPA: NAD(P)/FAD-dependent oxidoreductase [Bryobacteraceae bacterium]|nr:NAD(P)/FAD-dependent oxidoreductase [Bryobacteraceae bacterium]